MTSAVQTHFGYSVYPSTDSRSSVSTHTRIALPVCHKCPLSDYSNDLVKLCNLCVTLFTGAEWIGMLLTGCYIMQTGHIRTPALKHPLPTFSAGWFVGTFVPPSGLKLAKKARIMNDQIWRKMQEQRMCKNVWIIQMKSHKMNSFIFAQFTVRLYLLTSRIS